MVLDVTAEYMIDMIGHDGSDIWWPKLPEPYNRRAFHIQEIIDCFEEVGRSLTPVDVWPTSKPEFQEAGLIPIARELNFKLPHEMRIREYLSKREGILIGRTSQNKPHAVAWDRHHIHDPMGRSYDLDLFQMKNFWMA